jgi:hypothetical protein
MYGARRIRNLGTFGTYLRGGNGVVLMVSVESECIERE